MPVAAMLLTSPAILVALPLPSGLQVAGIVAVLVVVGAIGWKHWPRLTRAASPLLAGAAFGGFVVAVILIFPFNGLCGPESDAVVTGGRVAGIAAYAVVAFASLLRPFAWPLAFVAGAFGFDAFMGVGLAAGVDWSC